MSKLTTAQRKKLPKKAFIFPGKQAYPIADKAHAQNALARGSQNASPSQMAIIKTAVAKRYPNMMQKGMPPKSKKHPKMPPQMPMQ